MKAAIYARESVDDTSKAPPIQKQIELGIKELKEAGHEIAFIFKDDGFSGGDWNRPDWNRAIREAKGKHYRILWTWNQDRIARDTEQFLFFYRNLKDSSIIVLSGTEGEINMDDVGGMAKHTSLAMAAEIFRRITSEKVKRTYDRKKKEAEQLGEKVVWGRKPLKVNVEKIMELRRLGLGYKSIGKELGINYQKVRRVLLNPPPEFTLKLNLNPGVLK